MSDHAKALRRWVAANGPNVSEIYDGSWKGSLSAGADALERIPKLEAYVEALVDCGIAKMEGKTPPHTLDALDRLCKEAGCWDE